MKRILAITILVQTTLYAIRPMVSYRALDVGADAVDLGMIAASFSVLSLVIAVPVGRWVDRRGERGAVVAGTLIIGVVSALLVFIDSVPLLAANQAALGCGHIMNVVGTQAWIANRFTKNGSDRAFGHFTVMVSLGQLIGPAAAGVLAGPAVGRLLAGVAESEVSRTTSISLVFVTFGVISVLAAVLASGLRSVSKGGDVTAAPPKGERRTSLLGILRVPSMPHAMLVSLTVLTAVDLLGVYLPAYGVAHGISVETVGLLLATRAGASLLSRLVMGGLVERYGRGSVLLWSTGMPALPLLAMLLTDNVPALFVAMVVVGFGLGMGQPITLAWVAGQVPTETRGAALGLRLSVNRLSQVILPVGIGAIAAAFGVSAIFVTLAVMLGVSAGASRRASFKQQPNGEDTLGQ
jgi:MFS family permease